MIVVVWSNLDEARSGCPCVVKWTWALTRLLWLWLRTRERQKQKEEEKIKIKIKIKIEIERESERASCDVMVNRYLLIGVKCPYRPERYGAREGRTKDGRKQAGEEGTPATFPPSLLPFVLVAPSSFLPVTLMYPKYPPYLSEILRSRYLIQITASEKSGRRCRHSREPSLPSQSTQASTTLFI
ncbi:hypothetical protein LY76DRAFT_228251 [Colletotrichum caudatum]|nr:hypothetical protein LY76DRAFT_228251 [Colletotrichum caudatum]